MFPLFNRIFTIGFLAGCFLFSSANAELPPDVYAELQAKAPEEIRIKVDSINGQRLGLFDFSGKRDVVLVASVVSVTRSAAGLKAGDKIVIRYLHKPLGKGMAGPSPIPLLEKGRTYPAWLSQRAVGNYAPTARGFSFSSLKR